MNPTEYFSLQDYSTHSLRQVAERAQAEWLLIQIAAGDIELLPHGTERFVDVGRSTGAALIYSDYYTVNGEVDSREIGRRRVGKECRSRWSPYH